MNIMYPIKIVRSCRCMMVIQMRMREIRNNRKNIRLKRRRAASSRCENIIRLRGSKRDLGWDGVCSGSASQKSLPSSINNQGGWKCMPTPFTLVVRWAIHHYARKTEIYALSSKKEKEQRKKGCELLSPRCCQSMSS